MTKKKFLSTKLRIWENQCLFMSLWNAAMVQIRQRTTEIEAFKIQSSSPVSWHLRGSWKTKPRNRKKGERGFHWWCWLLAKTSDGDNKSNDSKEAKRKSY
ncbi:hypothetical protein J1N35_016710 [Gossypium stocksii]|uniref:Uncharacterized protein n=1 Tax=Gossypium stocksii TaxID=47602 RepID=A0A9D4A508_9ROSI|nr:hypothetical protein J1N35_016710 [Gossypium stocksii]